MKFDDDATPVPEKKVMDWYKWEKKERKYSYSISWDENTLNNGDEWHGDLFFNEDFSKIVSGKIGFKKAGKKASGMISGGHDHYVFEDEEVTFDLVKRCMPTSCQSTEKLELDGTCS